MFDLSKYKIDKGRTGRRLALLEGTRNIKINKSNIQSEFQKGECIAKYVKGYIDCNEISCSSCREYVATFPNFFDNYFKESNLELI